MENWFSLFKTELHSAAQNELILLFLNQTNMTLVNCIFIEVLEWNHLKAMTTLKTLDNGTEHTEEQKHILQVCSYNRFYHTAVQPVGGDKLIWIKWGPTQAIHRASPEIYILLAGANWKLLQFTT